MDTLEEPWRHFHSGVNHAGDARGMMGAWGYGIAASDVNAPLLGELELTGYCAVTHVFVDSGAFSEFKSGKLITDAEWRKRLALYAQLADAFSPSKLWLVAPDKIADQAETRARMERYAPEMRALLDRGVNLIVPAQKGDAPMAEYFRWAAQLLGVSPGRLVVGVPMKENATSAAELAELAEALCDYPTRARFHLLGLGPESPKYSPAMFAVLTACPWAEVTSDSVLTRRLVGRTNGPGKGPRALTKAQDEARAKGLAAPADVKAYGVRTVLDADHRKFVQAARRAGWYDEELESAPGVPLEPGCIDYGPGGPFGDAPPAPPQLSLFGEAA